MDVKPTCAMCGESITIAKWDCVMPEEYYTWICYACGCCSNKHFATREACELDATRRAPVLPPSTYIDALRLLLPLLPEWVNWVAQDYWSTQLNLEYFLIYESDPKIEPLEWHAPGLVGKIDLGIPKAEHWKRSLARIIRDATGKAVDVQLMEGE